MLLLITSLNGSAVVESFRSTKVTFFSILMEVIHAFIIGIDFSLLLVSFWIALMMLSKVGAVDRVLEMGEIEVATVVYVRYVTDLNILSNLLVLLLLLLYI